MIVLDTTFLIDLFRNHGNAVNKSLELEKEHTLATTCINIYELVLGLYSRRDFDHDKKLQDVEDLITNFIILGLDKESTIMSAKISGKLMSTGKIIGDNDCLTAGIALSNGISVIVTRNKEHFERIKGIKIESY